VNTLIFGANRPREFISVGGLQAGADEAKRLLDGLPRG
jgi:hypothetical protein